MRLPLLPATTLTFALALAASAPARADTVIDPGAPPGLKSERSALALSIGVTAASWGLVLTDHPVPGVIGIMGAYFGPSVAQLYAADRPHARGFLLRTAGAMSVLGGAYAAMACDPDCARPWVADGLYVLGALAIAAGTIDDIARQPALVRRHNRRIRELALAPLLTGDATGVAVSGSF